MDTYDVKRGIEHAIEVGLEMRARGELAGIRIDSGDLAWLARYARERLDAAGLVDCGIVLSNDLDEYTIESIRDQGPTSCRGRRHEACLRLRPAFLGGL
ncbi:MAG: hypothetical protein ACLTQI_00760 [Slackia sp.]